VNAPLADIPAAMDGLDQIDREVEAAKEAYAKFKRNCNPVLVAGWQLDSPPGHLPTADVERLRQLAHTMEVAQTCQRAAGPAKQLLARARITA